MSHVEGPKGSTIRPFLPMLIAWIAVCALSLWLRQDNIQNFWLIDADDHLRLVQVRDWMGGQSWFDVTQYRFEPPEGTRMHWSRLVDIPLAAGIGLLTPFIGSVEAERATLVLVPLLLLGLTMVIVSRLARKVMDRGSAVLAALLIGAAPLTLVQLLPLRIDHHGWQLAMAALCLLGIMLPNAKVSGVVAGLATATWLHVSIEALPLAVAAAGILGIRYVRSPTEDVRLQAYLAALLGGSWLLFIGTHLPSSWWSPYCDAVSQVHLLPLSVATMMVLGGSRISWMDRWTARALLLGIAGIVAAGALLIVNKSCAASPFATLDPLVYRYWYLFVPEGLPVWQQSLTQAAMLIWMPLVGAWGTMVAIREAKDQEIRRNWITIGFFLGAASLVSLLVYRAGGAAQLYALPGCANFIVHYVRRAQQSRRSSLRVLISATAVMIPLPLVPALAIQPFLPADAIAQTKWDECAGQRQLLPLASMPKAKFLAPLNLGPALLHYTPHSTLAAGYHRNLAMRDLIFAFMQPSQRAEEIVRSRGLDHVLICTTGIETAHYSEGRPDSLIAQLERGDAPEWLQPLPSYWRGGIRVWKVRPVRGNEAPAH